MLNFGELKLKYFGSQYALIGLRLSMHKQKVKQELYFICVCVNRKKRSLSNKNKSPVVLKICLIPKNKQKRPTQIANDPKKEKQHPSPFYHAVARRSRIKSFNGVNPYWRARTGRLNRIDCHDVGHRLAGQGSRVGHLVNVNSLKTPSPSPLSFGDCASSPALCEYLVKTL